MPKYHLHGDYCRALPSRNSMPKYPLHRDCCTALRSLQTQSIVSTGAVAQLSPLQTQSTVFMGTIAELSLSKLNAKVPSPQGLLQSSPSLQTQSTVSTGNVTELPLFKLKVPSLQALSQSSPLSKLNAKVPSTQGLLQSSPGCVCKIGAWKCTSNQVVIRQSTYLDEIKPGLVMFL